MPRKRSRAQEYQEIAPDALPVEVLREQKRKISQRNVAERRAAHFARSQPSSTPTGWVSSSTVTLSNTTDANAEKKEAWCGPFATAHRLLHQREQAKAKREKRIMDEANGFLCVTDDENDGDGDVYLVYDNYVANFRTGGKKEGMLELYFDYLLCSLFCQLLSCSQISHLHYTCYVRRYCARITDFTILPPPLSRRVKSLVEISLQCLAEHFDSVEDLGGSANADDRAKLGHLLSR